MSKTLKDLAAAKEHVAATQASVDRLRDQRAKLAAQAERVALTIAQARSTAEEATKALGDAIAAQTVGRALPEPIEGARDRMNRAIEKASAAASLEPERQALQAALSRLDSELQPQEEALHALLVAFRAQQEAALSGCLEERGKDLHSRFVPLLEGLADLIAEANALNSTAITHSLPSVYGPVHTPALVMEAVGKQGRMVVQLGERTATAREALAKSLRAQGLALRL